VRGASTPLPPQRRREPDEIAVGVGHPKVGCLPRPILDRLHDVDADVSGRLVEPVDVRHLDRDLDARPPREPADLGAEVVGPGKSVIVALEIEDVVAPTRASPSPPRGGRPGTRAVRTGGGTSGAAARSTGHDSTGHRTGDACRGPNRRPDCPTSPWTRRVTDGSTGRPSLWPVSRAAGWLGRTRSSTACTSRCRHHHSRSAGSRARGPRGHPARTTS
jgi:hypothetical protein